MPRSLQQRMRFFSRSSKWSWRSALQSTPWRGAQTSSSDVFNSLRPVQRSMPSWDRPFPFEICASCQLDAGFSCSRLLCTGRPYGQQHSALCIAARTAHLLLMRSIVGSLCIECLSISGGRYSSGRSGGSWCVSILSHFLSESRSRMDNTYESSYDLVIHWRMKRNLGRCVFVLDSVYYLKIDECFLCRRRGRVGT